MLQQFSSINLSHKISDSSEYDKSEVCSDELSDNELLEQANSLESKLLSDENIEEFIVEQKQENTEKKTKRDINVFFSEFLGEASSLPCSKLDKMLMCVKKQQQ